ncbi:MAG: radical SAM protein [Dehalococcoidales bacterium]|nr:radical SAM protein [Dehalococcoidales bacterium]
MNTFYPGYLSLYSSGELASRADSLSARLAACDICPRRCGVNRFAEETGFCNSGSLPVVASWCVHRGEEPPVSGTNGSGAVFFGNCTMRCVYCQNYQISQDWDSQKRNLISIDALGERMLELQGKGCHNINLVTPTHFIPQILQALLRAVPRGLSIPLVYNTSGYESVDVIKMLDGIVDIYLPDLRYASSETANVLSKTADYTMHARKSIKEMYRQVGDLKLNADGVATRGLIVRHLILPERLAGSEESITWLAKELSPTLTVSIMAQYYPTHRSSSFASLGRKITEAEYREVVALVNALEIENGWLQGMEAAETYLPDFARQKHPFENELKAKN